MWGEIEPAPKKRRTRVIITAGKSKPLEDTTAPAEASTSSNNRRDHSDIVAIVIP